MSSDATIMHLGELRRTIATIETDSAGLLPEALELKRDAQSRDLSAKTTDEALFLELRRGAREALSNLFRRYGRLVHRVAFRILRDEAEADDLVQDIFVFLFEKAHLYRAEHGSVRGWIVHVTYHRAFDRRRYLTARRFYTSETLDESLHQLIDERSKSSFEKWSLEGIWGKQSAEHLRSLLSPDQLMTIELHFFEGYSLDEIAELCGQPLPNIRNHYYRGLKKLKQPAFASKLRSK